MKEWSDEELDKLFRESSEKFDPTYEPGDWNELKQRLDTAENVDRGGWLKKSALWLATLLLILIGGIGAYLTIGGNEGEKVLPTAGTRPAGQYAETQLPTDAETNTEAGAVLHDSPSVVESASGEPSGVGSDSKTERKSSATRSVAGPIAANQAKQRETAQAANKEITNEKVPKELPRHPASVSGVRNRTDLTSRERGNGAVLSNKNKTAVREESSAALAESRAKSVSEFPGEAIAVLADRDEWAAPNLLDRRLTYVPSATTMNYPAVAYEIPADYVPAAPHTEPIEVPKWSVRIGIAPDLSMVRGSDMMGSANFGPAAAFLGEHGFSNRFSVQTGVISSLKNYYARSGEYEWAWAKKQSQAPSSVDVRCNVVEIPLNLRLDIIQNARSRWFVSAGVSSYKMQKEKQTYSYDTYVPNAMPGWEGKTGWYLLSHANVSVGYERFIARRLSIVAEPYARMPLRGVGMGKVDLVTMGVWFSVRYTPVFR